MRDATDEKISELTQRYREIETALYHRSNARFALERTLSARMDASVAANLPRGYLPYTLDYLCQTGNAYLSIDLRGPDGGIANRERLCARILHITSSEGRTHVVSSRDGVVAEVTAASAPTNGFGFDHAAGRKLEVPAWTALSHANQFGRYLLPLAGPFTTLHRPIRRMADFANALADGGFADLRKYDEQAEAMLDEQAHVLRLGLKAALSETGLGQAEVEAAHPEAVAAMRSFDWTWHYADRTPPGAYDRERAFHALLGQLPYGHLRALWMARAYSPMGITAWQPAKWAPGAVASRAA